MIVNYECPTCGEDVPVDHDRPKDLARCPQCDGLFAVDTDAEYVDGGWRDLTSLIPRKETP